MQGNLHAAVKSGKLEKVQSLIEAKSDVNRADRYGKRPLHFAAQNGHIAIIKALIAARAVVDAGCLEGETPLYMAAKAGHNDVVNALIKEGADIHHQAKNGSTALLAATRNGQALTLKTLIEQKGDPRISDKEGYSPIRVALLTTNNSEIQGVLQEVGALPADRDSFKSTSSLLWRRAIPAFSDIPLLTSGEQQEARNESRPQKQKKSCWCCFC